MMNMMPASESMANASELSDGYIRIGDMAKQFDVTLRTLRFYEDKGLLNPKREGNTRLYTQRERRFKDLWTCLLSDDKKIRDRAHAIVQAIANSSLVGAIAKVRIADLEQLHQLKSSTVQADKIKLRKMKGQLSDIFDRELSGIGG